MCAVGCTTACRHTSACSLPAPTILQPPTPGPGPDEPALGLAPEGDVEARADICVVGGGPAGSTAANRLARLGYQVILVEGGSRHASRVESLPWPILGLLESLGVRATLDQAGLLRPHRAL